MDQKHQTGGTRTRITRKRTRRTAGVAAATALIAVVVLIVGAVAPAGATGVHGHDDHGHRGENEYVRTDLVADQPGHAASTDPNLVNAWGMSAGPATPLWVSNNGTGTSTIYRGAVAGSPLVTVPLVVAIPDGKPTGQVFNTTTDFVLKNEATPAPAAFIFASESGHLTAWNPGVAPITSALNVATTPDAIYKGLALAGTSHGSFLYAANFHAGTVDVFDGAFMPVHRRGAFVDPFLPRHYAPFNVQAIDGRIYVTYAVQGDDKVDDVKGAGHGIVDVFSTEGRFLRRLISHVALNSPWGLAVAPANFGRFSGALLVGNFGDGRIHAFDKSTGHFLGTLRDEHHQPIVIDGLWGLLFGNGVAGDTNTLFFTAGPNDEANGLLGIIQAAS